MRKVSFTAGRIAAFECEPGKRQSLYWDARVPGLGVRVTASGSGSYIFESRLHGKTVRLTIGDVRAWSISEAQAEARRLRTLYDQGVDPRQQKRERRAKAQEARTEAMRQTITLGEAWADYVEVQKTRWVERTYWDHVKLAAAGGIEKKVGGGKTRPGPLASLMPLPLTELSGATIARWLHRESADRPTSTALCFRMLRAFMRWAADVDEYRNLIPEGSYRARAVRDAVPRIKPKEGDSLQREQLPLWFEAVRRLRNPIVSAYLQGLLLTGARREEMLSLRWEDIDFRWRSLTIRDKVEGVRTIPLTPYLASLLERLPRRNEWVFSSPNSADGRITDPRFAHNQALSAAGLPHVTLHGLRRSFGTLCEWVEMPSGISAQIMGHKPSALAEKHYRRRPLDLLRMWHDRIEVWILEQAGVKFTPSTLGLKAVV